MVSQQEASGGGKSFTAVWGVAEKPCDSCKSAVAVLFCRVDSAFLCLGCDSKIHGSTQARHERVWMCEVCEQAPAAVTCKADAAALCVTCDRDIHSANPLARRHERFPVVPFYDTAESVVKSAASSLILPGGDDDEDRKCSVTTITTTPVVVPETTPGSWVLPNPTPKLVTPEMKSIEMLFSDSEQFLDFDYPISIHNSGTDCVVPVQQQQQQQPIKSLQPILNQSSQNYLDFGFHCSKLNSFNNDDNNNNNNYTDQSLSQSISSSSVDVGVVPDGSSMSEISYPFGRVNNNCVDLGVSMNSGIGQGTMDREARVLRYREKRKNRKFEKTIRYASRKAYAETRPRIKGRFAKRTEVETEDVLVGRMFNSGSSGFMAELAEYGVVPSFF